MLEFIRKTLSSLMVLTLALGIFTIAAMLIIQPRLVSANESKKKKSGGFGNIHISIKLKNSTKSKNAAAQRKPKDLPVKRKYSAKRKSEQFAQLDLGKCW